MITQNKSAYKGTATRNILELSHFNKGLSFSKVILSPYRKVTVPHNARKTVVLADQLRALIIIYIYNF